MQESAISMNHSQAELEEIAVAVSHDLQEPLRMVICFTELLEKRFGDTLDADGHEYMRYANEGAKRMRDMLDGLRDYTRITTRGAALVAQDSQQILHRAIQTISNKIQQSGAVINVQNVLPWVLADQKQLQLLFKHLLDNAIKFCTAGNPPQIHLGARQQGRFWRFYIQDNGADIDRHYHQQIFRLFSTLQSKKDYVGTGMGLPICRRIVERHGGEIGVTSLEMGGKEFYFTLQAAH